MSQAAGFKQKKIKKKKNVSLTCDTLRIVRNGPQWFVT